jgi:hypothetical protein
MKFLDCRLYFCGVIVKFLINQLVKYFYFILIATVYDVTRRDTFTNLSEIWAKEIDLYSTNQDCIKLLVGNKVDKVIWLRFPACLARYSLNLALILLLKRDSSKFCVIAPPSILHIIYCFVLTKWSCLWVPYKQ